MSISNLLSHALLGGACIVFAGCSFLIEVNEHQCEQSSDCEEFGADTECVGFICVALEDVEDLKFSCQDVPWKPLDNNTQVPYGISMISLSNNLPVEGATIHSCNTLFDRECETPIETLVTDSTGSVEFQVPEGFRGHFFSPATNTLAPMILQSFPPPDSEDIISTVIPLSRANFGEIIGAASVLGIEVLPETGVYLFTVHDCLRNPLSGVQIVASPVLQTTAVAYLSTGGVPDVNLTHTGSMGTGAIINLPPGNVTIKGIHEEVGVIFEQTILIAPDTLTGSLVIPSQR